MSITVKQLCHDTVNFIRHQFSALLLLSLLFTAMATLIKEKILSINALPEFQTALKQLYTTHQLSDSSMSILLSVFPWLIAEILLLTLFICSILSLLNLVSQEKTSHVSALRALSNALPVFPVMLVFIFVYRLLITLGTLAFFVPGLFFYALLSMTPIILAVDRANLFSAMKNSGKILFAYFPPILFILFLNAAIKYVFLLLHTSLIVSNHVQSEFPLSLLGITLLEYVLQAFLLIYLFRVYMLIKK